jgi:diguanylate cyclase (GGDEF)-like protein
LSPFNNQPLQSGYLTLLRSFDLSLTFACVGWAGWQCGIHEDTSTEPSSQHPARDSLTGLCNRAAIDKRLLSQCLEVMEARSWLNVIIADIDHFRRFNTKHGHEEGDRLLVQVASVLGAMVIRSDDLLGRYGDQKFAIILPDATPKQASMLAERLRLAVADAKFVLKNGTLNTATITLGVASSHITDRIAPDELTKVAKQQMLKAKKAGRNQVLSTVLRDNKANVMPMLSSPKPDVMCKDLIQELLAPRLERLGS